MSQKFKIQRVKPVDKGDFGIRIEGLKLRWVGAYQNENNPGRIWTVLRKSDLDEAAIKHLEGINPAVFKGGDTIRRGDLTLAYATEEASQALRQELDNESRKNMQAISAAPSTRNNSMRVFESEISKMGAAAFNNRQGEKD
jgi:hypothetical protein